MLLYCPKLCKNSHVTLHYGFSQLVGAFDWFQSCLQGFWLVCEHSKWTPNISCPQNQCVSIIISLQLHNWMFLGRYSEKANVMQLHWDAACWHTKTSATEVALLGPNCRFLCLSSHVKFYVSIAYLFIIYGIFCLIWSRFQLPILGILSALYFLLKSVQQFHQHCEY